MSFLNLLHSSLLSLRTHKMRVFLTILGIIIGISSEVLILSIGAGLKEDVVKNTDKAGTNNINIVFTQDSISLTNTESAFDKKDLNYLERTVDGVEYVKRNGDVLTDVSGLEETGVLFDKQANLTLSAADKEVTLFCGQSITDQDNEFKNKVIILKYANAKRLFGSDVKEAIGKGIKIKGEYYEVIGVQKDVNDEYSVLTYDYVPKSVFASLEDQAPIVSLNVKVKQGFNHNEVFKKLKSSLKELHPNLKGEYEQQDTNEITKSFQKIINTLTIFIAIVSGISLFVGGVGVMNIMYVSVVERRKEIGIKRAIGARPKTILLEFLFESIIITLLGGIVGIICGYSISLIIGLFINFKPILTLNIILSSSIMSIIIGIVFGIVPAYNAAKLDPIKAIYK